MKSSTVWIIVLSVLLVLALVLPGILGFSRLGWHGGMMDGWGRMGGRGFLFPFGFFGMGLMMLWPVALLVLLVLGGVAIGKGLSRPSHPAPPPEALPSRACPNCSKPVQSDWNNCPYCGNPFSPRI